MSDIAVIETNQNLGYSLQLMKLKCVQYTAVGDRKSCLAYIPPNGQQKTKLKSIGTLFLYNKTLTSNYLRVNNNIIYL